MPTRLVIDLYAGEGAAAMAQNPVYQQWLRDYGAAAAAGQPAPELPLINRLPTQNPAPRPRVDLPQAARPFVPGMVRAGSRTEAPAGVVRIIDPLNPNSIPLPELEIFPERPPPLPGMVRAGSRTEVPAGQVRIIDPLNPLENPALARQREYLHSQPEYQQYLRDYRQAAEAGLPPPQQPYIRPMPDDYVPPNTRPVPTPNPERAPASNYTRPSPSPFAAPATAPPGSPQVPLPDPTPPRTANYRPEAASLAPPAVREAYAPRPVDLATPPTTTTIPNQPNRGRGRTPSMAPGLLPTIYPLIDGFIPPTWLPEGHPLQPYERLNNYVRDSLVPSQYRPNAGYAAGQALGDWVRRQVFNVPTPGQPLAEPDFPIPETPLIGGRGKIQVRIRTRITNPYNGNQVTEGEITQYYWGPVYAIFYYTGDTGPGTYIGGALGSIGVGIILSHGQTTELSADNTRSPTPVVNQAGVSISTGSQGYTYPGTVSAAWTQPGGEMPPLTDLAPAPVAVASAPSPFAPYPPLPLRAPAIAPTSSPLPSPNARAPAVTPSPVPINPPGGQPQQNPQGQPFQPFPIPAFRPATSAQPTNQPTPRSPTQEEENLSCRFRDDPYSEESLNQGRQANQKLDNILNLLGDAAIMGRLNTIDNKLGPQLTGGIGGVLRKFSRSNLVQNVLNLLTFLTTLHNAFMLSNQIRATLFSAFDSIYQLPWMQKFAPRDPETDEIIDYGEWASEATEEAFKSVFGDQTVETVQTVYKRANRIYQATANILFSLQSITFSILESMEVIGEWIAWIGNALKRFGAVGEKAYGWMNPQINFTNNRFFNALNNAQEAVEAIDEVAGEVLNIAETGTELQNQVTQLVNEVRAADLELGDGATFPYPTRPSAEAVQAAEVAARNESLGATINPADETRPEIPPTN